MILDRRIARRLAAGKVSQIRLKRRDDRPPFDAGQSIAIQPGPKPAICRATILAITSSWLGDATDEDAAREGFRGRGELFKWWRERYEGVAEASREEPPPTAYPVWVLVVERRPLTVAPRFLAKRFVDPLHPPQDAEGYSWRPTVDDLEAVPENVQTWISKEAKEAFDSPKAQAERAAQREQRSLETRLAEARHRARMAGIDVDTDVRVIEDRIRRMERKAERENGGERAA